LKIRADGHGIPDLLRAILTLFPLDTYVFAPVCLMDLVNRDKNSGMAEPPVWSQYQEILNTAAGHTVSVLKLERFEFYEAAKVHYR
jgi:L-fucose mutarotase